MNHYKIKTMKKIVYLLAAMQPTNLKAT